MRSIHSCTTLTYALHLFLSFHVSAIYVLHLFMRHNYSRLALIHLSHSFMCHFYSCFALIFVSYSPMRRTYLCVALIYLLHSFHASHSFNDVSHLFIRCIYSCIALSMRYVTSLFSRISHAAYSFLTLFFSLTCIKSPTSWQECFATTIKMSMQADVHKIYCWPTQLLFSLVLDSLNVYSYQSIFHITSAPNSHLWDLCPTSAPPFLRRPIEGASL